MRLSEVPPGTRVRIVRLGGGSPALRRRLMDMGVLSGEPVSVERVAPLGDPLEIRIRGYRLSLRREEAEKILVEVLS
ncbi:FeoA family protein [Thermosulfurimonas sp. F29]|uniref:FeoA family protein n=1 Tax=Thermosulfurimonas sp. F29 TaxID=2867247 RepID=UPI001C83156C|nr:FeoA family protein [Thermosulfurimonas sp. F29]MBX6422224.1 ferrous iron transport protein A [Thermosulfurimonas sp. F29]